MQQAAADLFFAAPGALVGHHQFRNPQAVLVAQGQQLDGAGEVVGQLHIVGRRDARSRFSGFDDETATHRIIGLLAEQAVVAVGVQGHGVGVVGQAFVQQQEVAVPVEGNFLLTGQQQPSGLAQLLDSRVDRSGIDLIRPFAHQAHDAGAVGGVADTSGGQRTIQAHFDPARFIQQVLVVQGLCEGRRRAHGADGMGAGRADAHFE
jgi:hypothetical protein